MSVRDGLLAILTLGPAYGLQLHAELAARSPHRGTVNPGQIYATLERLGRAGLIESGGRTHDGLPLHRLTPEGRSTADRWLRTPLAGGVPEWSEMLDQILVGATVDPVATERLTRDYRVRWSAELDAAREDAVDSGRETTIAGWASDARAAHARAALEWLAAVSDRLPAGTTARALSTVKPRRGRRPHDEPGAS
ncbi:PadR family transcriptional regulator [Marisediminicola sp. LYQ85]|uniref:PadR family transcriptional regulator n=1 Tax=Marisediminicola sp. LYQ85 TaxID=3391062 RepID=UPI0039833A26